MTQVETSSRGVPIAARLERIEPLVFRSRGDGLWAVAEPAQFFGAEVVFDGGRGPTRGPDGPDGVARVATGMEDLVLEAAEACPGECIYVMP